MLPQYKHRTRLSRVLKVCKVVRLDDIFRLFKKSILIVN